MELILPPEKPLADLVVIGRRREPEMQGLVPFGKEFRGQEVCNRTGGEEGSPPEGLGQRVEVLVRGVDEEVFRKMKGEAWEEVANKEGRKLGLKHRTPGVETGGDVGREVPGGEDGFELTFHLRQKTGGASGIRVVIVEIW